MISTKSHGIDLAKEYLEIAVCAQHNNGGIRGNIWWESNIKHLFPVGEVNGTYGVYRPGGSALNSGQVGSMRAAAYIAKKYTEDPLDERRFLARAGDQIKGRFDFAEKIMSQPVEDEAFLQSTREQIQGRMSSCGAFIRDPHNMKDTVAEAWKLYSRLKNETKVISPQKLPDAFKNLNLCLTHALYLEAVAEYLKKSGQSRGSYLVIDSRGEKPCQELGDEWKFRLNEEDCFVNRKILEIYLDDKLRVNKKWVDIRPVPQEEAWFENVWNEYMKDNVIK